ncbi:hypothetical protein Y1Q_0003939 [Alligator mississippiensis]|uniref:G-protein coupled receptors family 1 profile domain-containing protein n=1 Tax=Alligator mississippiensis TaxID=8496 RepID=A0A151P0M9_ALLMI|nr:hypothetical protein Y1Q_0003939 [Alligator mississippiensis]
MYFFLFHLAVVDIICTPTIMPKMLENLVTITSTLSFAGCIAQLSSFTWFLCTEMALFTVMAYNRYVAICYPLHYSTVMNKRVCCSLSTVVTIIAVTNSWVNIGLIVRLTFCGPNIMNYFFCEIPPLLALSYSSVKINKIMVFTADIFLAMGDFLLTCLSYCFILKAIMKIRTCEGKKKALYLLFSPHCGVSLLLHCYLHLHEASLQLCL